MSENTPAMLSIWFFVSIVLFAFGTLVFVSGFLYPPVHPQAVTEVLGDTNPGIWWGLLTMVFSVVLFLGDRLGARAGRK